jgi:hypothetical protein
VDERAQSPEEPEGGEIMINPVLSESQTSWTMHPSWAALDRSPFPVPAKPAVPVPSLAELLASPESPRIWLDAEFEVPLERAIAKVEENTSLVRGSQDWRSAVRSWYTTYWWEYWCEKPEIPFVPATDEQLREWEERYAMCRFNDEVKDLYRSTTTIERLRDHWREANAEAKKVVTPKKSERDDCRIRYFQDFIRDDLEITKKFLRVENAAPPPPPPPKLDIDLRPELFADDLQPELFADDTEGTPAKSIHETVTKLAPIVHYGLVEWCELPIKITDDYVFIGNKEFGAKVGRKEGAVWFSHHSDSKKPDGDILNLFMALSGIWDFQKAWRKLDAMRRRLELEAPEIRAAKTEKQEKRRRWAEDQFLIELELTIWNAMWKARRTSPPPTDSNKRAKKTVRAFWEWIFQRDGPVRASDLQGAFEYWEKTGGTSHFRVESKVYSEKTNWFVTEIGTPVTELPEFLPEPPQVAGSGRSFIQDMRSRCVK